MHDKGIRTYVLRQGRITDAQRRALEGEGRRFILPFDGRKLDQVGAFGRNAPLVLEIGFGMGLATWQIALGQPDIDYLGVEVHRPGVGRLVSDLVAEGVPNVRIFNNDAVEILEKAIPEGSLAGIHLFYPDPWPKKRHHKRRMVRPGLAELMASRLMEGGYLYFVTDIEDYALSALQTLESVPLLVNQHARFATSRSWRPETRFEARASAAGRSRWELYFMRRADDSLPRSLSDLPTRNTKAS
ncbi:MAG: tRNA (guanosine(46)-N7)-methyltransferase TrmB [Spirochaetota bacterium]